MYIKPEQANPDQKGQIIKIQRPDSKNSWTHRVINCKIYWKTEHNADSLLKSSG